jgi:hypothetical protein
MSGHVNVGIESVMSLENIGFKKLILNNNKYKRDEKKVYIALVFTLITSPFFTSCFR